MGRSRCKLYLEKDQAEAPMVAEVLVLLTQSPNGEKLDSSMIDILLFFSSGVGGEVRD